MSGYVEPQGRYLRWGKQLRSYLGNVTHHQLAPLIGLQRRVLGYLSDEGAGRAGLGLLSGLTPKPGRISLPRFAPMAPVSSVSSTVSSDRSRSEGSEHHGVAARGR